MVTSIVDGAPDMTDPGQAVDSESWDFALKLYAEPGIAGSCLSLQAECSVAVMMLLTATFAAVRLGGVLTPFEIAHLDADQRAPPGAGRSCGRCAPCEPP